MLQISARQMDHLEDACRKRYVIAILDREFPLLSRTLGADLRKEFAGRVAGKILRHDLHTAYAQNAFIRFAAMCGSHFDEDPIIDEPTRILEDNKVPDVVRIVELRRWFLDFRNVVYGANYEHYLSALHRVADLDAEILYIVNTPGNLIQYGRRLFPTLTEWLTPSREWALLQNCQSHLSRFGVHRDADFSLVAMCYSCCLFLGLSCLDDPLHDYVRVIVGSDSENKARELFDYSIKRAKSDIRSLVRRG